MNPLNLQPRLQTALSLAECAVLADIGTDHAYLPIAACLTGKSERAIACDINIGPLERARENIKSYNLHERIKTRLGGGISPLEPGEADCIVIAGMGGMRMIDILSEDGDVARNTKKLILQPQHDVYRLRKFLHQSFFSIYNEVLICDAGRYYTVLAASPSLERESWNELEYFYGKIILKRGGGTAEEFLRKEKEKLKFATLNINDPRKEFLESFVT